jgi:AraC family ethanolamine operon transcriptional activator
MSIPSPTYLIQRSFVDFDQLAEDAKQWQLDLRQLDCGSFQGELLQFGVGNVQITDARFGRSLLQTGAPPPGLRTIGVPAKSKMRLVWRGIQMTGNDILIFPQGAELASVSNPDFHIYTCSFPDDLLAEAANFMGVDTMDQLCGTTEVFRCRSEDINSLRRCLRRFSRNLRFNEKILLDPRFAAHVTLDLPCRLLKAIARSVGACVSKTSRKRDLALIRADAYIEQFAHEDLRIGDLCRVAQVSQRTLEYAFAERYGLTPKAFLVARRLNAVRRELRAANPSGQRIVDIANGWGFWHMGQFASDYRKQFGELPSQTLRG